MSIPENLLEGIDRLEPLPLTVQKLVSLLDDPDADFKGRERLKPEARDNIIGLQGQLWSEFVKGGESLEYCYLPKMLGLAERAWSGQAGWGDIGDFSQRMEAMNRDMNRFFNLIGHREMPRQKQKGGLRSSAEYIHRCKEKSKGSQRVRSSDSTGITERCQPG